MYCKKSLSRSEVIRLNAHGWYVEKIAADCNGTPQTVREVLHTWQKLGWEGLWKLPCRGGKPKWKQEDIEFVAECLKKEPRTYNVGSISSEIRKRVLY
jgi:transposase